jgi:enoyl-CoA hydratase
MAADQLVMTDVAEGIATITINRPAKLNALNVAVRRLLIETLEQLGNDPAVRVVIITGAGEKAFGAGSDIADFENRTTVDQFTVSRGATVYSAVAAFRKPLIAAVNGFCLGGGCELALACDIRIAAATARFGQPEVNLGLIPGGGGTQRLARLVGVGQAFKLIYTGEMISADEAFRIGLVEEVVAPDALLARARALAASIATKSPVALTLIKEALQASLELPLAEGLRLESALFGVAFSSDDKREGVRAFLEKRRPTFHGREERSSD